MIPLYYREGHGKALYEAKAKKCNLSGVLREQLLVCTWEGRGVRESSCDDSKVKKWNLSGIFWVIQECFKISLENSGKSVWKREGGESSCDDAALLFHLLCIMHFTSSHRLSVLLRDHSSTGPCPTTTYFALEFCAGSSWLREWLAGKNISP